MLAEVRVIANSLSLPEAERPNIFEIQQKLDLIIGNEYTLDDIDRANQVITDGQEAIAENLRISNQAAVLEVNPIVRQKKGSDYSLKAELAGDADDYKELAVSITRISDGECVADAYFTVTEEGEPKVLFTTDGDGLGDKQLTVYPLRAADNAAVKETS